MSVAVLPQVNLPQGALQKSAPLRQKIDSQKRVGVDTQNVNPEEPKLVLLDAEQLVIAALLMSLKDTEQMGGTKKGDENPPGDEDPEDPVGNPYKPYKSSKSPKSSKPRPDRKIPGVPRPEDVRRKLSSLGPYAKRGELKKAEGIVRKRAKVIGAPAAPSDVAVAANERERIPDRATTRRFINFLKDWVKIPDDKWPEITTKFYSTLQGLLASMAMYDLSSENSYLTAIFTTLMDAIIPFIPSPAESITGVGNVVVNLGKMAASAAPGVIPLVVMLAAGFLTRQGFQWLLSLRNTDIRSAVRGVVQGLSAVGRFAGDPKGQLKDLMKNLISKFLKYIDMEESKMHTEDIDRFAAALSVRAPQRVEEQLAKLVVEPSANMLPEPPAGAAGAAGAAALPPELRRMSPAQQAVLEARRAAEEALRRAQAEKAAASAAALPPELRGMSPVKQAELKARLEAAAAASAAAAPLSAAAAEAAIQRARARAAAASAAAASAAAAPSEPRRTRFSSAAAPAPPDSAPAPPAAVPGKRRGPEPPPPGSSPQGGKRRTRRHRKNNLRRRTQKR